MFVVLLWNVVVHELGHPDHIFHVAATLATGSDYSDGHIIEIDGAEEKAVFWHSDEGQGGDLFYGRIVPGDEWKHFCLVSTQLAFPYTKVLQTQLDLC